MVDTQARANLAASLQKLVTGEMTNDDFDDAYYRCWIRSPDAAVRQIAHFGFGLYSSDLLVPFKLVGSNAVSEEGQRIARNALRFLSTHQEYVGPQKSMPSSPFGACGGQASILELDFSRSFSQYGGSLKIAFSSWSLGC